MWKKGLAIGLTVAFAMAVGIGFTVFTQQAQVPQIPGITAEDTHPNGCVDCHKKTDSADYRLSATIVAWASKGVDQDILDKVKPAFPSDAPASGKHPDVSAMIASSTIPDVCLSCHKEGTKSPPELSKLLHLIHFKGDPAGNAFLTSYGGFCTNCHKIGDDGDMVLKSGKE